MARVFVRLKLTLLGNGFRRGWQQAVGIIAASIYALPLAMLASRGVANLGRGDAAPALVEPVLVLGFTAVWIAWLVGPLLAFGMDETLDPGRLRLLPLRRRELMIGLLAASAIGIGPLATAILLYGVVVGFTPADLGTLVVVAAAVVQFLLCIACARALTTALSQRLSSRRGRDLATVFAALLGLAVAGLVQLPRFALEGEGPQAIERLLVSLSAAADAVTLLPPAWAARAVLAAAAGDVATGLLWLAAAAGAVAAAMWWWAVNLERSFDAPRAVAAPQREADLFPAALRWLPRNRFGADVAKDVRYAWRVPQLRVQYVILLLMLIPTAFFVATSSAHPEFVLASPVVLLLVGATGMNLFGGDRGAVWLLDVTGPRPRTDLLAKSAVAAGLGLIAVVAIAVVLAFVTAGWSYVPVAVLLGVGATGVITGVGIVVSVLAPFPLPDSPTNVFAANAGAGCSAVILQGVGLFVELVLLAPLAAVAAVSLVRGSPPLGVVAAAAVAVGAGVWWLGWRIASRRITQRAPEFIAALQPRAG